MIGSMGDFQGGSGNKYGGDATSGNHGDTKSKFGQGGGSWANTTYGGGQSSNYTMLIIGAVAIAVLFIIKK